jgi:hypothetical protein
VANWETSISHASAENSLPPSSGDPVLGDLVRRLIDVYYPLRIYLFGSADGTLAALRDSSRAYQAI